MGKFEDKPRLSTDVPSSSRGVPLGAGVDPSLEHWTLQALPERILWCTRCSVPYMTPSHAQLVLFALNERLLPFPRSKWALLLDARYGPMPGADPGIEAVIVKMRRKLFEGFAGAAVLVRTATGQMQVARQAHQDGLQFGVFSDESAARAYLMGRLA